MGVLESRTAIAVSSGNAISTQVFVSALWLALRQAVRRQVDLCRQEHAGIVALKVEQCGGIVLKPISEGRTASLLRVTATSS